MIFGDGWFEVLMCGTMHKMLCFRNFNLRNARSTNGSLFAAVSSGIAICLSGVMVLSEVTIIVFVRAS